MITSRALLLAVIGLGAHNAFADNTAYKDWRTFRSDYGYELKYPSCWQAKGDGPDEPKIANSSSMDISIEETNECKRPAMDQSVPNGISVSTVPAQRNAKNEGLKNILSIEKHVATNLARNEWKIYKRINPPKGGIGYFFVENETNKYHPYIRWHLRLYCFDKLISFVGPMIERPGNTYDERFRAGDLSLPEPEKSIYESVRCVEPKRK